MLVLPTVELLDYFVSMRVSLIRPCLGRNTGVELAERAQLYTQRSIIVCG